MIPCLLYRKFLVLWLVLVLLAAVPASGSPPVGVRDIVLGMKGADLLRVLAANGVYSCAALTCRQTLLVKDVPVDGFFILAGGTGGMADAKLWEIRLSFDEHRFPLLREALVEKYGSPSRSARISFRLGDGKSKVRETVLWYLGGGEISITNISTDGGAGKGGIVMSSGSAGKGF